MKKVLTLRNVLIWVGALLAIAAFFVAFAVTITMDGTETLTNVVIGKQFVVIGSVRKELAAKNVVHSTTALIGIIFMLVGGIAAAVLGLFVKAKWKKWAILGAALVIFAGAILSFFVVEGYAIGNVDKQIREGKLDSAKRAEMIKKYLEIYEKENFELNAAAFIVAVIGILSTAALVVSQFVKDKRLAK